MSRIMIWNTIQVGTHKTAGAFRAAFWNKRVHLIGMANEMLNQPAFVVEPAIRSVNLVKVTVRELGFSASVSKEKIRRQARSHGLHSCLIETAPQLCLQGEDEPNDKWIHVMTEDFLDSDRFRCAFEIGWSGSFRCLRGVYSSVHFLYGLDTEFVFEGPR